jgi:hypothetical protein
MQRVTWKKRRAWGNRPFSTYFTQVRLTPKGTRFSVLQATVRAWQPMHLRLSIMNPYLIYLQYRFQVSGRQDPLTLLLGKYILSPVQCAEQ